MEGFSARPNGFHVSFKNGYSLSTQFGYENYCEGHEDFINHMNELQKSRDIVKDCEIAILFNDELVVPDKLKSLFEHDSVRGWVSVNDWFNILTRVKELEPPKES